MSNVREFVSVFCKKQMLMMCGLVGMVLMCSCNQNGDDVKIAGQVDAAVPVEFSTNFSELYTKGSESVSSLNFYGWYLDKDVTVDRYTYTSSYLKTALTAPDWKASKSVFAPQSGKELHCMAGTMNTSGSTTDGDLRFAPLLDTEGGDLVLKQQYISLMKRYGEGTKSIKFDEFPVFNSFNFVKPVVECANSQLSVTVDAVPTYTYFRPTSVILKNGASVSDNSSLVYDTWSYTSDSVPQLVSTKKAAVDKILYTPYCSQVSVDYTVTIKDAVGTLVSSKVYNKVYDLSNYKTANTAYTVKTKVVVDSEIGTEIYPLSVEFSSLSGQDVNFTDKTSEMTAK